MARAARRGLFAKLYFSAMITGAMAGTAASALHAAIDALVHWHQRLAGATAPSLVRVGASIAVGAAVVCLARILVRRLAPEASGSGIQEVEGALAGERQLNWRRVIPTKFVAGVLAIGAGLSLGREGPSIHLGGCFGRMLADRSRLGHAEANALIAAGAGGGLAAAFNAPLAGVLLIVEEMRREMPLTGVALHALLIACCTATVISKIGFGLGPMLALPALAAPPLAVWPLFMLLGVLIGTFGVIFNSLLLRVLALFDRLNRQRGDLIAAAVGGFAGLCLALFPSLAGEGTELLERLIADLPSPAYLVGLLLLRTFLLAVSYGLGVPGGIFAPMLALGTIAGLAFGGIAEALFPGLPCAAATFAVAAMGALITASVRAPLTAILLVAELTGSFSALPAMITTCLMASLTAQLLGGRPIYEQLLARSPAKAAAPAT